MSEEKILNDRFDIRVNDEDKQEFIDRCESIGRAPQIIFREIIAAFNENRLRILADKKFKSLQEIYHVD